MKYYKFQFWNLFLIMGIYEKKAILILNPLLWFFKNLILFFEPG